MPMSLRKNPPKKEVFEQETPPLSKKVKTTQTPKVFPQIGTAHRSTIAPKLPTPTARGGSVRYIQSPLSISSRNETSGLSSPSAIVKTDKNNGSESPSEQIIWVGDVIQKLAAATDLGPFVRENETKLRRSPCQISLIEAVKALKRWPEDRIPSLALDGELEYYLFPDHDDDTSGADLRTFYGRMIITCLQKKTHPIVPNCGKTLTGYFESGIWNTLLYSAIETIARSSAVIQALESAMTGVMSSWSDQAQDVPNSSQVPSLITDENWTDPSTPTETVRSMSAEAVSSAKPGCSYNGHALSAPTSKHTESAAPAFIGSSVGNSPSPAYISTPSLLMQNIRPGSVRSQVAHSSDSHNSPLSYSATCDTPSDQINPYAKGPAIDKAVLQLLEGMKAELTHAKPMVNIILSDEEAKATRDLYRSFKDYAIKSATHNPASSEYSPAPAVLPRIPIVPPPGYQVIYHSPYSELGYGSSGSSTDPGCPAWKDIAVSSHATSRSTKLRLPRLAPKAGRKSR